MIPSPEEGEKRMRYRAQMKSLTSLNEAAVMARAIRATKDTLEGLQPMQPPNLQELINKLERLPLKVEEQPGSIGKAVDVLTGSWQFDRGRCKMILSEWDLGSRLR